MGLIQKDDGWRIPDALWLEIEKLLPKPKWHPLGCYRRGNSPRAIMNAILLVMRSGMQWNALKLTNLCSSSAAHRRFQEWTRAGVFTQLWKAGLLKYDQLEGIDWSWLAMDGAMTKAPLGGEKNRPQPDGPRQGRDKTQRHRGRQRIAAGAGDRRGQPSRRETDKTNARRHRGPAAKTDKRKTAGLVFGQRLRLERSAWASG